MQDSVSMAEWVRSGGTVAFAILVYMELRLLRPILRSLELTTQALLERERSRSGPVRIVPKEENP